MYYSLPFAILVKQYMFIALNKSPFPFFPVFPRTVITQSISTNSSFIATTDFSVFMRLFITVPVLNINKVSLLKKLKL